MPSAIGPENNTLWREASAALAPPLAIDVSDTSEERSSEDKELNSATLALLDRERDFLKKTITPLIAMRAGFVSSYLQFILMSSFHFVFNVLRHPWNYVNVIIEPIWTGVFVLAILFFGKNAFWSVVFFVGTVIGFGVFDPDRPYETFSESSYQVLNTYIFN